MKEFGDLCFRLGFIVLHNKTDLPFITSDNPVCVFDPALTLENRRPYQSDGATALMFPIDSHHLLYGHSAVRPAVSWAEFDQVQRALGRADKPRPQRRAFAFTGLIRCGGCGLMVTAETRTKPSGKEYSYYHCTKRTLGPRCSEPAIRAGDLETQIADFLRGLTISPWIERQILDQVRKDEQRTASLKDTQVVSLNPALSDIRVQERSLTQLRLRNLIDDLEFSGERARLITEEVRLTEALSNAERAESRFELAQTLLSFNKYAVDWFAKGDAALKREIVKLVGSNPTLKGKKLSIQAAKPFQLTLEMASVLLLCGLRNDVRINSLDSLLEGLCEWSDPQTKEAKEFVSDMRKIQREYEDEHLPQAA